MNKKDSDKKDKGQSLRKKKTIEIEDQKMEKLIERFKAENKALVNMLKAIKKENNTDDKKLNTK